MGGSLVVDTSALMAILLDEPDAVRFASALQEAASLRMSAANWVEAMQVITARRGDVGGEGLSQLLDGLGVEIVACDAVQARLVFQAWLNFGKGRHPAALNFGDCFSYALAKQRGDPLLFKGDDFSRTDVAVAP